VEWGEGVFGAQAAARHYFHVDASSWARMQAARLAVMLPAPKRFEKNPARPMWPAALAPSWRAWAVSNCPEHT
jgi:membrane peptidoglycan carboxypeptidase